MHLFPSCLRKDNYNFLITLITQNASANASGLKTFSGATIGLLIFYFAPAGQLAVCCVYIIEPMFAGGPCSLNQK